MGKPKKRTSPRATGARRSHLILKLARVVNKKSPIKAVTTRRETGKKLAAATKIAKPTKVAKKKVAKKATKKSE